MVSCDFTFAGRSIRVEGPAADLAWLTEFLVPQFGVGPAVRLGQRVRLLVDSDQYARLASRGPHPDRTSVSCFTLDSGNVLATRWNGLNGEFVVFDETIDVFYRRPGGEPELVEALAAEASGRARVAVMRIVRELGMGYARQRGSLLVHGAALSVGGRAFVIAGPKAAGKTTLLVHLLLRTGGKFITNDRVGMAAEGGQVLALGIPTIVSLRTSFGVWFPALEERLRRARYHHRFTLDESHALLPDLGGPQPPLLRSLSPRQFCHLLGSNAEAVAPVTALLFPCVASDVSGVVVEALPRDEALARLNRSLLPSAPPDAMFDVDGAERSPRSVTAEDLVARLPSFECRLGTHAYENGAEWFPRLCRL
jgi:hypothetical protein